MSGYTKLIDGYWQSSQKQVDDTWMPIIKEEGTIVSPQGLVDQLANEEIVKLQAEAKQAKLDALASLTVTTTNGNTFDADDVARQDMLSAIEASNLLGTTEQAWKIADNSWVVIQLAELKEANALAIQAKGAILAGA